jgi:dipeptidyl aminopeptidase/acylaminoacyl peptidase
MGHEGVAQRCWYAEDLKLRAPVRRNMAIVDAFATVARERFLGPGPWSIQAYPHDVFLTPNDDPHWVYHDVLVSIDPARQLNNGMPSLWARNFDHLDLKRDQRIMQVGAGTGYYAAVLAEIVGPSGRVIAVECDEELAARARISLNPWHQVDVEVEEQNTGLLRRRLLFADPERSVVRISHDGARIAFRAPVGGVLNLWVAPIDRIGDARPVTAVTDRNLGPWIVWMHDNRHVVFFREAAGDENWRAWRADLETGDVRPLTPGPGVTCYIQQHSCHFPSELLIAHNARDKRYFDIYRINVATGESKLVQLNEGFTHHFTDQQFRVRFAMRRTEDGDGEYLQRGPDGEWALFSRIGAEDAITTRAIEFSADGRELYWLDSRGRDTAAVVAQDLATGAMRVLAEDPRADFTELVLDPISERPVAAARSFERVAWQVLDRDYRDDFDYLTRQSRGDLTIASMSQDRRHWIVAYQYDDAPLEYFHYHRAARQARRLFSSTPAWEGLPFVPMEPVVIRTRDGLELVSYLSRPRGVQPRKPLPMVLAVHGGPWERNVWGHSNVTTSPPWSGAPVVRAGCRIK